MVQYVKNMHLNIYEALITFFIIAAIVFQGGYFPTEYIPLFVILCGLILLKLKLNIETKLDARIFILTGLLAVLYLVSSVVSSNDKYTSVLEMFKILSFSLFPILCSYDNGRNIFCRGIYSGCLIVAAGGILSYLDIINFSGAVLSYGNTVRMQSFLQYANVTALLTGIGFFITLFFIQSIGKFKERMKYSISGFIFFTSTLLTFSRGAIVIFLFMLIIYLILQKSMKITLISIAIFFSSGICAYLMNYFVSQRKYVFAAFALIALMLFAAGMMIAIEKCTVKLSRKVFTVSIVSSAGHLYKINRSGRWECQTDKGSSQRKNTGI